MYLILIILFFLKKFSDMLIKRLKNLYDIYKNLIILKKIKKKKKLNNH